MNVQFSTGRPMVLNIEPQLVPPVKPDHLAFVQAAVPLSLLVVTLAVAAYAVTKRALEKKQLQSSAVNLGKDLSLSKDQTQDLVQAVMNCAQAVQGKPMARVDLIKTLYNALPAAVRQKLPTPQKIQFDLIDAEKEANEIYRRLYKQPSNLSGKTLDQLVQDEVEKFKGQGKYWTALVLEQKIRGIKPGPGKNSIAFTKPAEKLESITHRLSPKVQAFIAQNAQPLQQQLNELQKRGWTIEFGPDSGGSKCIFSQNKIILRESLKKNTSLLISDLAHEVGHALSERKVDESSEENFVRDNLTEEGYAILNELKTARDLKRIRFPIKVAGIADPNNPYLAELNKIFDKYEKNPTQAAKLIGEAAKKFSAKTGNGELMVDYYIRVYRDAGAKGQIP